MEAVEFVNFGKEMVDYVAHYLENIKDRQVLPSVDPGYLRPLIPAEAPQYPEKWTDVMADIERVIMPGITHWHSPKFHAYFSAANSYPAIVADILCSGLTCIGFSWVASPACTELEVVMMDWLGKMLNLPDEFLASSGGKGGGVIQGSASESTLVALLGAKAKKLKEVREEHPDWNDQVIVSKLVGYCSEQSHCSVQRAGLLGGTKIRLLPTDKRDSMRGAILEDAIKSDLAAGLIPFYAVCTLGTTSCCSFDRLDEIGPVGLKYNVWVHIDAAYAGAAFVCPEFRSLMKGIETVQSFNFNPHKWLLVNYDCSAMWMKDPNWVIDAFNVDPLYLKHDQQANAPDFRHWQIPMGRRFRALKIWFVLRLYGVDGLQKHIRHHCGLAKKFSELCAKDPRFEIYGDVVLGLVCFRLKHGNDLSETLLRKINTRKNIHMVPAKINDVYFLRMAVCSRFTTSEDIQYTWNETKACADEIFAERYRGDH